MANNKPFIVKSGLIPQTDNDQDLGGANNKFANAHISNLSGAVQINSAFTLPTTDGSSGNVLQTDGAGNITWVDLAAVTFSDSAPSSPQSGDLWFDSGTTAELFIWTGNEWISATGGDQAAFTMREFTGDGNTTVFNTGVGSNVRAFVYLNGVLLQDTNDYSFSNGTLTFVTAPALNDLIQVMLHGLAEYIDLAALGIENHDTIVVDSSGNTTVSGNIIPDTDITYDLGSATNRFRDLYLSGNSIELGDRTITSNNIPEVDLAIAPEILEIQVSAPAAGQDTAWLWTWEQSTLPYARRTITNSPEISVPLYKQGTYTINNYAAYDLFESMTQTHTLYIKWIDGAGSDNLVSWATSTGPVSDSHPDINSGNATDVQRINISVPATITLPTLTAPSVSYTVTNNGAGAYTFSGSAKGDNPNIGPFYRGGTYTFNVSATGHPFYLTTDNGTNFSAGTYFGEYTSGVTGSRSDSGTVTIVVPNDAPDTLYYQCGNHSAMRGAITIKDLAVEVNNNGNYVIYAQHTQEGHKTPIELRPIPSLVNQMCLVYDSSTNKFVPQDLATYVENTPSFENKIREVAGTAELVVEDGSAVIAKVNVYDDSTYLPLTGNNAGDQAFATDTNILYIWDGSAWQQAGASNTNDLTEGGNNLFYTDARVDTRLSSGSVATIETTGDVTVGGNLTVNGSTTTLNSTTLTVDDLNITVASGAADAATANGAGITVDGANATLTYGSLYDSWAFNKELRLLNNKGLFWDVAAGGASIGLKADTSDNINFRTGGNWDRLVIANNGYVGVGTNNPGERLVVNGNTHTSGNIRALDGVNGNGVHIGIDGGIEVIRNSNDSGFIDFKNTVSEDFDVRIQSYTSGEMLRFSLGGDGSTGTALEIGAPNSTRPSILALDSGYAGANAGDFYKSASFKSNHSNVAYFDFIDHRDGDNASYTGWTGMGKRIQMKIDSTYMGWMQFNGTGNNGGISFGTGTQGAGSDPTLVPEKMRLNASGNLGIGVTNPSQKLDVAGSIALDGSILSESLTPMAYFTGTPNLGQTGEARLQIGAKGQGSLSQSLASNHASIMAEHELISSAHSANLVLDVGGSGKIKLNHNTVIDGNVGIKTTDLNGLLHVQHSAQDTPIILANRYNDSSTGSEFRAIFAVSEYDPNSGVAGQTWIGNHNRMTHIGSVFDANGSVSSGIPHLTITETGNVGIGTNTPTATYTPTLHVYGSNPNLHLEGSGTGSWAYFELENVNYNRAFGMATNGAFRITDDNTNMNTGIQLELLQNGNLGVGVSNPSRQLHIFDSGRAGNYRLLVEGDTSHTGIEIKNQASANTNLLFRNPSWTQEIYMSSAGTLYVGYDSVGEPAIEIAPHSADYHKYVRIHNSHYLRQNNNYKKVLYKSSGSSAQTHRIARMRKHYWGSGVLKLEIHRTYYTSYQHGVFICDGHTRHSHSPYVNVRTISNNNGCPTPYWGSIVNVSQEEGYADLYIDVPAYYGYVVVCEVNGANVVEDDDMYSGVSANIFYLDG